jgi:ABC-type nitrate/sulfonate/bicarbonate transport system substrate-binding protein
LVRNTIPTVEQLKKLWNSASLEFAVSKNLKPSVIVTNTPPAIFFKLGSFEALAVALLARGPSFGVVVAKFENGRFRRENYTTYALDWEQLMIKTVSEMKFSNSLLSY